MEKDSNNGHHNHKTVAFHTLGCRLNSAETGLIAQGFIDRGHRIVPFGQEADVVFINTCTVTDKADSACRNIIRKAVQSSPEGKIVVAGCYAQMEAKKVKSISGVDLVLGNSEKYRVFDYLERESQNLIKIEQSNEFWGAFTTPANHHTRAFLKTQDGCNYRCSFCIIPFARGRSRAISSAAAIIKAQQLVDCGVKEIVLTGVNIGEYQASSGERLSGLLKGLAAIEGLKRIRLSSVEPNTITDELLEVMSSSNKFLDHFHIPLQSGDDKILHVMRRKYNTDTYARIIKKIKAAFPRAGIGADLIVGFPGESEQQFRRTFDFLRELPITHFHVFPYSKRKNTAAARMDGHLPHGIKRRRVKSLISLGESKLQAFAKQQVMSKTRVLFEQQDSQGYWKGYSSNFIKVRVPSDENLKNQVRTVRILRSREAELHGSI